MSRLDNALGSRVSSGSIGEGCGLRRSAELTYFAFRFEFDHVDLHPSRRQYLEHTFATIKSFNGR